MSALGRLPPLARVSAAALLAVGPGCETATQIVVYVDTDMDPSAGEISAFGIEVLGDGEPAHVERSHIDLADEPMPASFGVAPIDGDASRSAEVRISALFGEDDSPMFTTRARTTFIAHRRLRLDMYLARRCRVEGTICGEQGMTCGFLGCMDPDIVLTGDEEVPDYPGWARVPEWTRPLEIHGASPDREIYVAVDGDAIFVAGTFTGTMAMDEGSTPNEGISAGFVEKLLPSGEILWRIPLLPDGPDDEVHVRGIAAAGGWIHVAGTVTGTIRSFALPITQGQTVPVSALARPSAFVLSVDHNGQLPTDGEGPTVSGNDPQSSIEVRDVAASSDGTIAITGRMEGNADLFGNQLRDLPAGFFVSTSNPSFCAVSRGGGEGVALGPSGSLRVVVLEDDGSVDVRTIAGCPAPGPPLDGLRAERPLRMAVDGREGETEIVVVAGTGNQLPAYLGCSTAVHGLVLRMGDWSPTWVHGLCSDGEDGVFDVAIDEMGTSYVVGRAGGAMTIAGVPDAVPAGPFAAAFDADGNLLWAVQEDVLDMSEPASVTYMARTGAIVVAGLDSGDGYVVRSFFPR